LLRARANATRGILNGIDDAVWDPANDALIAKPFDATHLRKRRANKAELQARLGLAVEPERLLFGVISRLTWQKGLDLLLEAVPELLMRDAQLALLGSGDAALVEGFTSAAAAHPGQVGCVIGYNETLAHLIQAGADAILVPSRFEPCGLTQLCALRYGALPVVARVGGLADSVIDANEMALADGVGTGLQFAPVTRDALAGAVQRAAELWRVPKLWRTLQRNAMRTDVSWRRPAARYAALYREILDERAA
jgi:starch synthase